MLRSLHLPLLRFTISRFHRCNPSRIPSSCAIASLSKYPSIAPPKASLLASSSRSRSCGVSGAFRMCSGGSETNPDGNISAAAAAAPSPSVRNPDICFCQACGSPTKKVIPDGEEKVRSVCTGCGRIHYENPKMVVGCLVEHDNKVLLCRRKIEPSYGLWTLPAGYVEVGESAAEGAIRETLEEARADVEIISPFAQLDIPQIGQYIEDIKAGKLKFHYCTINKRPGASPSDLCGFDTDYHLHS